MSNGRSDTPATYSPEEARQVRTAFRKLDADLVCPRCGDTLDVYPPLKVESGVIQELCCPSCHRCMVMRNQPERPATVE